MEIFNFIGGEFVPAESKKTFEKISPFDGQVLARTAASEVMDFLKALPLAKKAATAFKTSSLEERAQLLEKCQSYLLSAAAEISYQEALHQGLSKKFVSEFVVDFSAQLLQKTVQELRAGSPVMATPVGVVGVITAWTCSLRLVMERLVPALAAGNAVLIKVSEHSPITGKIIGEMAQAAALPVGLVQVLQGDSAMGELLAGHPGVRAVTAVGKPATMESIAKVASAQLKKIQLNSGAKNAAIVLADADFERDMALILKSFLIGQGQMCWNTSRLFIPEAVAPAFMEKAKACIQALQPLRNPHGEELWMPLIAKNHQITMNEKTAEAISEHGKKVAGGENLEKGFFVRPALILDLHQCSVLQQDEVPGSLILVTPVKYQHEAVKWANTSYLGHSAVIWGSAEKALKVAGQLEVGHVAINSWGDSMTPSFFGHKQSSFGNPDLSWNGSFFSDVKKLAGV